MADSPIGSLTRISTELTSTDLFALERDGAARSVSGSQLTEYINRNVVDVQITALASTASITHSYNASTGVLTIGIPVGQGIASISKTSTSGLRDTYTVYRDDGTAVDTFVLTNGSSIQSIARTSGDGSSGSTDVYTVTLTNGNTHQFSVYNGLDGEGTVNSVNGVAPDQSLNVTINADQINCLDGNSIETHFNSILDLIYPVGSIYMSVNSENPSTLFPRTTWTQIQDTFLLAAGSTYAGGDTGGEAYHQLTTTELPAHTHGSKSLTGEFGLKKTNSGGHIAWFSDGIVSIEDGENSVQPLAVGSTSQLMTTISIDATHEHDSVGADNAHNNMPPYLAVYVWQRTA